jgi:hypothetical protein
MVCIDYMFNQYNESGVDIRLQYTIKQVLFLSMCIYIYSNHRPVR